MEKLARNHPAKGNFSHPTLLFIGALDMTQEKCRNILLTSFLGRRQYS
jgi:hypothetical protein